MGTNIIDLEHIDVTFQTGKNETVQAVKDVTLQVEKGDIYGVVGYSGAGKSTLVRTINLLQKPTAGRARSKVKCCLLITSSRSATQNCRKSDATSE